MLLGQLYWALGLNTSGLQKDSQKASGILGKLSGGMGGLFNPAAIGISAVAGAALKLGKDAYEFSKQFNSAMLEVKTISAAAQADFAGMSQSIVDISLQGVNDDAVGLSKAMYQIVSAGYDGAQGLAILESAAKAATGGVTDTLTAADGLTTVLNAWGMSASEVNTVSDQMFTTVKLGKTTMGELGKNIAKVAPLAAATGIAFEEVAAATATMTSQGTPTTEVMTQMKAAIVALNKNLGDGWAATMTLQEGLMKMRDMAGGSDVKLQELTGSSEAALAVLSMTGDNAEKAAEQLRLMGDSAGASSAALAVMQEDAGVLWQQVGNQFKAAMLGIGDGLLEASKGLASFLSASMTGKDQLGDNFDQIGESVDSFSERMKVLKNEGVGFWGALTGAAVKSNDSVQKIVDKEKAEVQKTADAAKKLQDEYNAMVAGGASEVALEMWKQDQKKIFEEKQKTFAEQQTRLEAANKTAKWSNAATLGLGSMQVDRTGILAKQAKDEKDAAQKLIDEISNFGVAAKKSEAKKKAEIEKAAFDIATKQAEENAKGVLQRLEEQLSDLKKKEGTFLDAKTEAKNADLIIAKQNEIGAAWRKVTDERFGTWEKTEKIQAKTTSIVPIKDPIKLNGTLAIVKKLTEEEQKQLNIIKKQNDEEILLDVSRASNIEKLENISYALAVSSDLLGSMSDLASQFDDELGKSLGQMSGIAGEAANFVGNIASGNWIGAITSGLGLVSQIVGISKENAEEQNRLAEEYNQLLSERIDLLVQAGIISTNEANARKLNELQRDYNQMIRDLGAMKIGLDLTTYDDQFNLVTQKVSRSLESIMTEVYGNNWGLDELNDFIENTSEKLNDLYDVENIDWDTSNAFDELYNQMLAIKGEMIDLGMGLFESNSIAENIVDGIMSGFQLAEDGLGEFGDNFNKTLSDAARQAMITTFTDKYLQDLIAKFNAAAGGGFTEQEIADLQDFYAESVKQVQEDAKQWEAVLGATSPADLSVDSGMGKAIAGISEETGSLIEGQFNALRINTLDIIDIMDEHTGYLSDIASNTLESNRLLKIIANQSPTTAAQPSPRSYT